MCICLTCPQFLVEKSIFFHVEILYVVDNVCSVSEAVQLEDGCSSPHAVQPPGDGGTVRFSSNVSRLKSRFLQHVSEVAEPTCSQRRPILEHHSSPPPGSTTPETTASSLLDMTDHVEKFRHTRALFAQLAEQSTTMRPPPLSRPIPRSFRATSSASPPPTRHGHVDPGRRSVSPSSDLHNSGSLHQAQGQTRSINGVTTWSQIGSRSQPEGSRSLPSSRASAESSWSEVTSRSLFESSRLSSWRTGSVDAGDAAGVVLRRNNRPSLDLSAGTCRTVLLPKRRSREEKSLMVSKDCLEASLCEADEYWRRQQLEEYAVGEATDPLMSESTFSSGSGEEMARSESGHDLAAALKDSTLSPTADSAEMWSRRLSAAMEAKNSELDSCRNGSVVECNGSDHVTSCATENSGTVTLSRSLCGRGDLENTAWNSLCHSCALTCNSLDSSCHIIVQNSVGRTAPNAVNLSKSADSSKSSVNCDREIVAGTSLAVSDIVKGSTASNHQPHDSRDNLSTAVSHSVSYSEQRDVNNVSGTRSTVSEPAKQNGTNAAGHHVTSDVVGSQPAASNFTVPLAACQLERGSSTDCETLEGSVADCECKDFDTEKSCPKSTVSSESVASPTSVLTTSVCAAADGGVQIARQEEGSDCLARQSDINEKSVDSGSRSIAEVGSTDQEPLEQPKEMYSAECCGADSVQESLVSNGLHENVKVMVRHESGRASPGLDTDVCLRRADVHSLPANGGWHAAVYLQKTEDTDTIWLEQQRERVNGGCVEEAAAMEKWNGDDGHGGVGVEAGTRAHDHSEVQAMSVSEDDESSGDTDYVVLGEPVSKQAAGASATQNGVR